MTRASRMPVLSMLAASLIGLCAWLVIHPGAESHRVPELALPRSAAAPLPAPLATEAPVRIAATELRTPEPAPVAAAWSSRPRTLVHGSLLDSSDAPIQANSSAAVSFVDNKGRSRTSVAGADGDFTLPELEFGTYCVTARADGYRTLEEQVVLRPERPRMRRDFTLQKAVELRIRVVTPDGKSLFDVLEQMRAPMGARQLVPIATRESPGKRLDDGRGPGRFQNDGPRVERLPPGCIGLLSLDCELPVFVSLVHHQVVLQTVRVGSGEEEVSFVLSPDALLASLASIRVRVIDEQTRLPLPGARVMPWGGNYSNAGVATDPQGSATIAPREPGSFELQVWAKGYERYRALVDAPPGELTDLGTIALEQEVTLEGRVLDGEGRGRAASFSLGILDPLEHSIRWLPQEGFESRGNGSFEIRGLGRKQYVIRTDNHDAADRGEWQGVPWVSGDVLVDASGGSISGLEVRLCPASRLVLDRTGVAAGELRFRVVDEHGLELIEGCLRGSSPRPLDLPAGSYRVLLSDPDGTLLSERLVVLELPR